MYEQELNMYRRQIFFFIFGFIISYLFLFNSWFQKVPENKVLLITISLLFISKDVINAPFKNISPYYIDSSFTDTTSYFSIMGRQFPDKNTKTVSSGNTSSDTLYYKPVTRSALSGDGSFFNDTVITFHVSNSVGNLFLHYTEKYKLKDNDWNYPEDVSTIIEVRKTRNGKPIQVIREGSDDSYYFSLQRMEDVNFDGYMDMKFYLTRGSNMFTRNELYAYYIYNPRTGLFEKANKCTFDSSAREWNYDFQFGNPRPIPSDKIVYEYWRMGSADGIFTLSKWNDSVLYRSKNMNIRKTIPKMK